MAVINVSVILDGTYTENLFYNLNYCSRFGLDVTTAICIDASKPPYMSGSMNRISAGGSNNAPRNWEISGAVTVTANSAITEIKLSPQYKFVSGIGNAGRFVAGGRLRIYGVRV